ncbi:MAG TPA: DUF5597 domain-containing protein [Terriglobales bacterium]|nr:DUF5597 domain-containing protein [Terriglobales bacterium]
MNTKHVVIALLLTLLMSPNAVRAQNSDIPRLEKRGATTHLIVEGKPFLVLGGELWNSSSSSVDYMKPIWPKLAAMNLNTVLTPVSWELIEPTEGKFDFTIIDGLISDARANKLRLVFLWFGTWKNTYSSYVPEWVKRDVKRFPRVQRRDGQLTERITPFSDNARQADARAFAALMRHIKEVDTARTVIMVQVENEVGVIPDSRDFSDIANQAFAGAVPQELVAMIRKNIDTIQPELRDAWVTAGRKTSGSWPEVFGKVPITDDFFMTWQYAKYIEAVASAGKAEYPLPLFVNAALIRPNYQPGQYNSGGPLPHSLDIWKLVAPHVDLLTPDIYFEEFVHWASRYATPNNALFIPEAIGGPTGAANAFYAFGQLKAFGFVPYAIDTDPSTAASRPSAENLRSGAEKRPEQTIKQSYAILSKLAPLILEKQASGEIAAMVLEGEAQRFGRFSLGNYLFTVNRAGGPNASRDDRVSVMALQLGPDEYVFAGSGNIGVTFNPLTAGPPIAGIASVDEEVLTSNGWQKQRRLNGDENGQGTVLRMNAETDRTCYYRVRLYRY